MPTPPRPGRPATHYSTATGAGEQPAAGPPGVSATVAGFDGVPIATITRHHEGADDGPAVVSVAGDVDADTGPLLHTALTEAIDSRPRVCCELSGADFFGAAGVNALLAAQQHAVAAGCHFTVRGVHGTARWALAVTGIDQHLLQE